MNNKFLKLTLLSFLMISIFSCQKILDIDTYRYIKSENALASKQNIEAATMGVYSYLRNTNEYGEQYIVYPELLADNAVQSGRTSNLKNVANNVSGSQMSGWHSAYEGIVQANVILDRLKNFNASQSWKDSIAGQLYFLRALYYHNLTRIFSYDPTAIISSRDKGTVPIILKGVTGTEDIKFGIPRAPIEDMYAQLYADLDTAYQLLAGTPKTVAPHYVTQGAVAALYSRVALYNGDYQKAVDEADSAIASGIATFSTHDSYVHDWRQPVHPESMFEVQFVDDDNIGVNNSIHSMFTTHASVDEFNLFKGNGYAVVSDDLYDLYKDNDVRKGLIFFGLGSHNKSLHEMTKFLSKNGRYGLDNVPVIRLSEVYLNRAEAYAHLEGDQDKAIDDLNKIRERAGLDPVFGLQEDNLINAILLQRRLELAFEGDRFFTLKRLGMDIHKPDGKVVPFNDFRMLGRIPWREFNANPDLSQNKGY